jgi:SAM-dependent methyltransferase
VSDSNGSSIVQSQIGSSERASRLAKLQVIGLARSHDTLQRVLGSRPPCKVLDVPAGQGVLCEFLKSRGWDVHAADIDPGNFKLRDVSFTRVNLNKALPFDDASFDAVCCVNGLHRLLFPGIAVREFARILRPGGRLYINVNNYASIWKRLRYLLAGSLDRTLDTQECTQTIDDPEANVRFALSFPRLRAILDATGFEIADVQPAAMNRRDRLLKPLAFLVHGLSRLVPGHTRRDVGMVDGNHLSVLAGGDYIFIEAFNRQGGNVAQGQVPRPS